MSDIAAFEPVWEDMQKTREHLAAMIGAMQDAGLIEAVCSHPNAIPVALVLTGEVVAALCPDCDEQLPAEVWQHRRALLAPPTTSELFAGTTEEPTP